jgi:hypothetical protein
MHFLHLLILHLSLKFPVILDFLPVNAASDGFLRKPAARVSI